MDAWRSQRKLTQLPALSNCCTAPHEDGLDAAFGDRLTTPDHPYFRRSFAAIMRIRGPAGGTVNATDLGPHDPTGEYADAVSLGNPTRSAFEALVPVQVTHHNVVEVTGQVIALTPRGPYSSASSPPTNDPTCRSCSGRSPCAGCKPGSTDCADREGWLSPVSEKAIRYCSGATRRNGSRWGRSGARTG